MSRRGEDHGPANTARPRARRRAGRRRRPACTRPPRSGGCRCRSSCAPRWTCCRRRRSPSTPTSARRWRPAPASSTGCPPRTRSRATPSSSTTSPTPATASTRRSPPPAACPGRPTARSPARPRVRRSRRPGRPAGVRRRRGVPGRVGAAVRAAAQRGAAHRRDPRQGGRPPAGDGAARQPRLVRRAGLVPPQLLRVLGAARRAAGRGAHRGAPDRPARRRRRLGRVPVPQLLRGAAVAAVVAVGRRQPARRADRRRAAVLLPRRPPAPRRREGHPLHGDARAGWRPSARARRPTPPRPTARSTPCCGSSTACSGTPSATGSGSC